MGGSILLDEVEILGRDERGHIYAWRSKERLAEFKDVSSAIRYLDEHPELLDREIQFFTGSASLLGALNAHLLSKQGGKK